MHSGAGFGVRHTVHFDSCKFVLCNVTSLSQVQARYDTKVVGSYVPELLKIARERGIGGLYSGLLPTLVRAFPANAALFLGVEVSKRFFDDVVWKS
jgi:hypothetical protein